MFIINQYGDRCEELKTLQIKYFLSEYGERKLRKIQEDSKIFFPTKDIEEKIKNLKKECEDECTYCSIIVNENIFGQYKREIGDMIFDNIICSLNSGQRLYDLRSWEEVNG